MAEGIPTIGKIRQASPKKRQNQAASQSEVLQKRLVRRKKVPIKRDILGNPIEPSRFSQVSKRAQGKRTTAAKRRVLEPGAANLAKPAVKRRKKVLETRNPSSGETVSPAEGGRLVRKGSRTDLPILAQSPDSSKRGRRLTPEEIKARKVKKATKEPLEVQETLSEEELLKCKQETEAKRQEEEKKCLEEEERKKKEEEKLRLEQEAEAKRLEEEKVRQEKERQNIYNKIEALRMHLSADEKKLAEKIASEMVRRNICWNGYITLHGGIGGAMLKE